MARIFFLSFLLTLATALHGTHAVDYVVTNKAGASPGGVRFNTDIGAKYSRQTLISATGFIWRVFQQNTAADRKSVQKVTLIIDNITGVAYASNNEIHVSAGYIAEPGILSHKAYMLEPKNSAIMFRNLINLPFVLCL
ncbi:hypothetical protein GBA52_027623 [Prunus armeniaca]|nr:hypothetical protein GBA52_027623 [Prunus armeniaca]